MQRMYDNILHMELVWRGPLSTAAHEDTRSIIGSMLQRKVEDRLGCGEEGAAEIKAHPFFAEPFSFEKVFNREYTPEFIPPNKDETDVSNFDAEFTNERAEDSVVQSNLSAADVEKTKFSGFTFDGGAGHLE